MIDISHLRTLIVRPTLKYMDMWSEVAEDLVVGTAIQESRATYLKQFGTGPAVGIFQMEPATHDDLWNNFIKFRRPIAEKLYNMKMSNHLEPLFVKVSANEMIGNLYYAVAMCRIQYKRAPTTLPEIGDIGGLAAYWKQYYNTPLGAGTVDEFIHNYTKFNKV